MTKEVPPVRIALADHVTNNCSQVYSNIATPRRNNHKSKAKSGLITVFAQHSVASLANEDPYNHLTIFYYLCSIIGVTQNEEENLYMRVFSFFFLIRDVLMWLDTRPS